MSIYIGLDIGGTKLIVAAADLNGNIIKRQRKATPVSLADGLNLLHEMIHYISDNENIEAIGAAVGGPLDWRAGIVSPLNQPQWRNVLLKKIMEDKYNCLFYVDVDTNIAALAEYYLNELTVQKFCYITISTGVGGGFLVNGEIYRGTNDAHPEVGHQGIPFHCSYPERIECACGATDCLQSLISGQSIEKIYKKSAECLTKNEWGEVAYNLGQGLRNIAALYTPDLITVGGGVAIGGGEKFIDNAIKVMADNLRIVPVPEVRLSTFGNDSALLGTVFIAQHGLK